MQSKMSSFNKELFLQIIRSVGWVSIVYFIGLFIALPIRVMMTFSKDQLGPVKVENLFYFDYEIQMALLIAVPVLMSVFLFRFLHVKQAADLMHSLPIKRAKIYHHYCLTGGVLLILPVVFITIIMFIIHSILDLGLFFDGKDILYWAGVTILFNLVMMICGVFVAMMTGISAVQAVLSYIFMAFPVGITLLVFYNLRITLYGFPGDFLLSRDLEKYSPLTYALMLQNRPLQWGYVFGFSALAIILYWLSLYFYQIRKVEAAQEAVAFSKLRSVFKYGVTFCMMLFGGAYFYEIENSGRGWVIFGYILGAAIGYFIAEMVLQKTWRVLGSIKGFVIYGLAVTVIFTAVQSLGFYEKKLPALAEVENVILTDQPYVLSENPDIYGEYFIPTPLVSEQNKKEIIKLHKQIIADKDMNEKLKDGKYETALFMYTLKDGSKLTRQYRVNRDVYEDSYSKIYESAEFKQGTNQIFHININKVSSITISSPLATKKNTIVSNPTEINQAIAALKADILEETYQDQFYYDSRSQGIELFINKQQSVYLNYKPNYQHFKKWLTNQGLFEIATVTATDVDKITVAKINTTDFLDINELISDIEKSHNPLTVTKDEQIEHCLQQAGTMAKQKYAAAVYYNGGPTEVFFFDEAHAPEFVKKHFN